MSHKPWQRVFSMLLVAGLLFALFQPASFAVAQQAPASPGQVVAGPEVLPADTTGLPPAPNSEPVPDDQSSQPGLPNASLLPKSQAPFNNPQPGGSDPVVQSVLGPQSMPTPILNFEGINNIDGVLPPDTDGEVGKDHYVQMVNLSMAVYNKSGTRLYGPFHPTNLWPVGDVCRNNNDGDVVVLYDQLADRWLISQFALPNYPLGPYYECIGISKAGTPTNAPSSWWLYTFLVSSTKMNDYPKLSVWPDGYYMTVNQFKNNASAWGGAGVFVFNRAKMLSGQAANFQYVDLEGVNREFGGMLPADLDGSRLPPNGSPAFFLEVDDSQFLGSHDALRLWKFHVDWANPSNSTFGLSGQPNAILNVASFDLLPCVNSGSRSCIPQKSDAHKLDSVGDRLMFRAAYRNFGDHESIVLNHTVWADGADRAGVRWYEVRNPSATPVLYQQGTFAPADGQYRWMGSLAMDHMGDIALGYSISSSTLDPSIRYTGRSVNDPLGQMPQGEATIVTGTGAQTSSWLRWGDYSAMSVDPVDDCTFWYTQEYIQSTGKIGSAPWQTRIASFKFPNCYVSNQGTLAGVVRNAATHAAISGATIQVSQGGSPVASTTTATDGSYSIPLQVGTYSSVTASAYGYQTGTTNNVVIDSDQTTTINFNLTPIPTYIVSGSVTDAANGRPLYAQVTIDGYPGGPVWSDPLTGAYQVTLLGGASYTFHAAAWISGYLPFSQDVGPVNSNLNLNIGLDHDPTTCTAPGYAVNLQGFSEDFNSGSLPVDWTNITNILEGGVWLFDDPGKRGNLTGGSGGFAILDSDYYGLGATQDAELRSPVFNMTSYSSVFLEFDTYLKFFNDGIHHEVADVDISSNGGSSWVNVWHHTDTDPNIPATHVQLDVTAQAAGQSQVMVRFHYYNASWDYYWEVDNFFLGEHICNALPGGLVVGNIYDKNTGSALNGATVSQDTGYSTTSASTTSDPSRPDGFYTLFSPSGSHTVQAALTSYVQGSAGVSVPLNGAVRKDFSLSAGRLTFSPGQVYAQILPGGAPRALPVRVTNNGSASATINLVEAAGALQAIGPFQTPDFIVKPFKRHSPTSQELNLPAPPDAPGFSTPVAVLNSWSHIPVAGMWGIAFDAQNGTVWLSSPSPAWGGDARLYELTTAGATTGRSYPYTYNPTSGPADAAYDWVTHKLWIAGVDDGDCIYEVDLAAGQTDRQVCPPVTQYVLRGLAYDPTTYSFFAGGWGDSLIYRFDSTGRLLSQVKTGLAVAGLAYNPATRHLYVMTNAAPNPVYVLDVADDYAILGKFTIPGFSDFGGAGLEFDPGGHLWAVDQIAGKVYQVDVGETFDLGVADVPWLSESPDRATIPAGQTVTISVTLDPTGLSLGGYLAQITFEHDTPYPVPLLLVDLEVVDKYHMYLPILR